MLSIIIPFRNEENNLSPIVEKIKEKLYDIDNEIILINDFSDDLSFNKALNISNKYSKVKVLNNEEKGLGGAIKLGINNSNGIFLTIMMADLSDDVNDLKKYYDLISNNNIDAVFGTRFSKESKIINYPLKKLIMNRIFNYLVKFLYLSDYNDFTNAFKIYKKSSILKLMPIVSDNFNIFLELPLKIISKRFTYKIIPINWYGRFKGKSKFVYKKLLFKYFFTLFYCWLEMLLNLKKNKFEKIN